jgi:hypothetical protein
MRDKICGKLLSFILVILLIFLCACRTNFEKGSMNLLSPVVLCVPNPLSEDVMGYITHRGDVAFQQTFYQARYFSDGLAPVANEYGQWGSGLKAFKVV